MIVEFDLRRIASEAVLALWRQADQDDVCGCHLCHADAVLNAITKDKETS